MEILEGSEGIKTLFDKTLQNKEKLIRTVLVDQPLVFLAGVDYAKKYMARREQSGIYLKSLRLSDVKDQTLLLKEVKRCPGLKISKSLVIWDDYIAIVDDKIFLIKNEKNSMNVKDWFDRVWN